MVCRVSFVCACVVPCCLLGMRVCVCVCVRVLCTCTCSTQLLSSPLANVPAGHSAVSMGGLPKLGGVKRELCIQGLMWPCRVCYGGNSCTPVTNYQATLLATHMLTQQVGVLARDCLQVHAWCDLRVPLPMHVAVLRHLRIRRWMRHPPRSPSQHRSGPWSAAVAAVTVVRVRHGRVRQRRCLCLCVVAVMCAFACACSGAYEDDCVHEHVHVCVRAVL